MPDITELLQQAGRGERQARDLLVDRIYAELHQLAKRFLASERPGHTLQASALVNEAWVKLFGGKTVDWENRAHFYVSAARTMRRILVDYARATQAAKRPGSQERAEMTDALARVEERSDELIAIDAALEKLAACDPRQAQIVELRFYAGLTVEETASTMNLSEKTVKREWSSARAWLRGQIRSELT